jgi:hypothetical protein
MSYLKNVFISQLLCSYFNCIKSWKWRANRLITLTITVRSSGNLGRLFTAP